MEAAFYAVKREIADEFSNRAADSIAGRVHPPMASVLKCIEQYLGWEKRSTRRIKIRLLLEGSNPPPTTIIISE